MPTPRVEEIACKTLLNRARTGFSEYTLNVYQGCAFACSFCYVPVMRDRHRVGNERPWGTWVQAKMNAADVLRREMLRVPETARIQIGTATDSWQVAEKRCGISRKVLEELAHYPNPVRLLTRSPLLIRDIDILARMADVSVGVSVSSFDDRARRVFEPTAPAIPGRVALIRRLVARGIRVRLFWCPLLYGVSDTAAAVAEYLEAAAALGVRKVVCDTLSYADVLGANHMRLLRLYRECAGAPQGPTLTRPQLRAEIARKSAECGIDCRL